MKIIGIGNLLFQDEGIGVRVIHELQTSQLLPNDIELIDGGTDGVKLLGDIDNADYLIIVDAVDTIGNPGDVITLGKKEIPYFPNSKLSVHQQSVTELLALSALRGNEPKDVYFIGIIPEEVEWGTSLTKTIEEKIPYIISLIEEKVKQWKKNIADENF